MQNKNIVYVNYSPYENQGKILDFLLERFENIFLISLSHHSIGKRKLTNKLTVYQKGKVKEEIYFPLLHVPPQLVFLVLPIRSALNVFQIILKSLWLKKEYGEIDMYFSVNGFTAWVGVVLRKLGIVRKTIYWVCDYYPVNHKSLVIRIMRWVYWQLEKKAVTSDILAFHNKRLVEVWKKAGVLPKGYRSLLIPIATDKTSNPKKKPKTLSLVFLGVLKRSQGLDFVLDSADELYKNFPKLVVNVVGPGPDTNYFKKRARKTKLKFKFHGYLSEKDVDKVISSSAIGVAPYVPDPTTVSYFGDPGKIKRYISKGLPVIATNIHEFSSALERENAGALVQYGNVGQLVEAVRKIKGNYVKMSKSAAKLSKKYYYKGVYPKMLEFDD